MSMQSFDYADLVDEGMLGTLSTPSSASYEV